MLHERVKKVELVIGASLVALAMVSAITWAHIQRLSAAVARMEASVASLERARGVGEEPASVSPLLLDYQLDVPGRGEVFPAMAASSAPEYWPVATLRITNSANRPAAQTIAAEIPGWSRRMEQSLIIGPRETRQIGVQPDLLPRAYQNHEIRHAVLEVRAMSHEGVTVYTDSRPVLIHGGSEIYWGRKFANAQVAARWVTPHDSLVLDLISKARAYVARGRMAGYSGATGDRGAVSRHVRAQAKGIFRALQNSRVSYVNSIFVMGEYVGQAQRLRLPSETMRLRSANCMDVSLVFASAMENLGMQPLLVIVPKHAFVGVRLGPDSEDVLYLDLTVLPRGSFESAVARARDWVRKTPPEQMLVVDVMAARALGIYPLAAEYS